MAEFLKTIETIQAETASVKSLYGGEGTSVKAVQGEKLAEAAKIVENANTGKPHGSLVLREAMATTDFPIYFGNIIDRQMLESYKEIPTVWTSFVKRKTVPDFRTVKRLYFNGTDGVLPGVNELGAYQPVTATEGAYAYSVSKYGATFGVSWETLVNDDLDFITEQPERFARAARRTEEHFAASLLTDDAHFFDESNTVTVSGTTPTMSVATLTQALQMFSEQADSANEPIYVPAKVLMVPPSMEIPAKAILNSIELQYNGTDVTVHATNFLSSGLTLVVNPYIASDAWYLLADPAEGRGAFEMGFLRGHEEPEVFMKNPDAIRVGGGIDPLNGSYANDSIEYKVRHVLGGTQLDKKYAVKVAPASN